MKKFVVATLAALIITGYTTGITCAATSANKPIMKNAIAKYKKGNYTGCLQDVSQVLASDKSNTMAYYYAAISYVKIGESDKARSAYETVQKLNTNPTLTAYAKRGLACLSGPETEGCKVQAKSLDELEQFVKQKNQLSPDVEREVKMIQLNRAKNQINTEIQQMKTTPQPTPAVNQTSEGPSDAEIAQAVKTLAKVGLNVLPQANALATQYQQSPELAQLNMLMGNNSNQTSYNNNMMAIMPYLLSQSQNGQNNVSPEILKTMMMSSLMGDFSAFDSKSNDY